MNSYQSPSVTDINAQAIALLAMTCDATALPPTLSGSFAPGVYCSDAAVTLNSGTFTLDAGGDSSATFVFIVNGALTSTGTNVGGGVAADPQFILSNGAQKSNVYWVVTGASPSVTFTDVQFIGNIIADHGITLTRSNLQGKALSTSSTDGAITLTTSTVNSG